MLPGWYVLTGTSSGAPVRSGIRSYPHLPLGAFSDPVAATLLGAKPGQASFCLTLSQWKFIFGAIAGETTGVEPVPFGERPSAVDTSLPGIKTELPEPPVGPEVPRDFIAQNIAEQQGMTGRSGPDS